VKTTTLKMLGAAVVAGALALLSAAAQTADEIGAPQEQGAPTASGSGPLTTETVVELLDAPDADALHARRRFVPADNVRAGDEVYYTIRVHNPGRTPVSNVVVTKRLPYGMLYARGSAVGPASEVQFSVDGGETFGPPAELEVQPTGQPRRRAVIGDYTHVRWLLRYPLSPGATALLRFRATLN